MCRAVRSITSRRARNHHRSASRQKAAHIAELRKLHAPALATVEARLRASTGLSVVVISVVVHGLCGADLHDETTPRPSDDSIDSFSELLTPMRTLSHSPPRRTGPSPPPPPPHARAMHGLVPSRSPSPGLSMSASLPTNSSRRSRAILRSDLASITEEPDEPSISEVIDRRRASDHGGSLLDSNERMLSNERTGAAFGGSDESLSLSRATPKPVRRRLSELSLGGRRHSLGDSSSSTRRSVEDESSSDSHALLGARPLRTVSAGNSVSPPDTGEPDSFFSPLPLRVRVSRGDTLMNVILAIVVELRIQKWSDWAFFDGGPRLPDYVRVDEVGAVVLTRAASNIVLSHSCLAAEAWQSAALVHRAPPLRQYRQPTRR